MAHSKRPKNAKLASIRVTPASLFQEPDFSKTCGFRRDLEEVGSFDLCNNIWAGRPPENVIEIWEIWDFLSSKYGTNMGQFHDFSVRYGTYMGQYPPFQNLKMELDNKKYCNGRKF